MQLLQRFSYLYANFTPLKRQKCCVEIGLLAIFKLCVSWILLPLVPNFALIITTSSVMTSMIATGICLTPAFGERPSKQNSKNAKPRTIFMLAAPCLQLSVRAKARAKRSASRPAVKNGDSAKDDDGASDSESVDADSSRLIYLTYLSLTPPNSLTQCSNSRRFQTYCDLFALEVAK